MKCCNTNGNFGTLTPTQITNLTQSIDFTQFTQEQLTEFCAVAATCNLGGGGDIDFTQLTPEQITDLVQTLDFTQLTPEQVTALCTVLTDCINGAIGGATTNELTIDGNAGLLVSTVNGVASTITLQPANDAFGNPIGFLLPLA